MNMRSRETFGREKTLTDTDGSVLVGVQEFLPRRRRQRFALVVLARNGLSNARTPRGVGPGRTLWSARQPVPGKQDGKSSCQRFSASSFVAFHRRSVLLHE